MFSADQAMEWIRRTAAVIDEHAVMLTRLDSAIGDGDHGANMTRGFRAVLERVDGLQEKDLASLFRTVGMALIGKVGGAAGPLYGSLYLAMGKQLGAAGEAGDGELAAALRAGYDGVVARGKAQPGDKTMLDAWYPALEALDRAVDGGAQLGAALDQAAAAAEEGMKATIPLVARKGRASYLGERSRDHQDPGATSSYLLVRALADTVNGR
ncbi:MAG TPA: dihydroxyacetone kinase subunit DhaL [Actinomycetes bacterium]|jgi:dihydroxyacetone kinase-like protein|nr:dihydroxyacetone kinase subunit DhaL [Actinomycetes bacterium]